MSLIHHVAGGASAGPGWSTTPTGHVASTPNIDFLYPLNGDYADASGSLGDLTPLRATMPPFATVNVAEDGIDEYFTALSGVNQLFHIDTSLPNQGDGASDYTVAMLCRHMDTGGKYCVTFADDSGLNWSIGYNQTRARAVYNGASTIQTAVTTFNAYETTTDWFHVCLVLTDNTTDRDLDLYINGANVVSASAAALHTITTNPYLVIGANAKAQVSFGAKANIKSVIGINDALTSGEVASLSAAALA